MMQSLPKPYNTLPEIHLFGNKLLIILQVANVIILKLYYNYLPA